MESAVPGLQLDNALWRFVLPFYARDGVSSACLTLQEALGVDVNILLFAIFAQIERGIVLDADNLATVDQLVRDWRAEVVQPLRQVRTRMKSGPSPAPSAVTDSVRNRIKAAELEAEQIELAVLADWLERQAPQSMGGATDIPLMVACYFRERNARPLTSEADAALKVLSQVIGEVNGGGPAGHLSGVS